MYKLKNSFIVSVGWLVVVSVPSVLSAQDRRPSEASDVQVVKYSWSKERVGWERDPFGGPIENFDEMRVRTRNEKRIMDAKRGGSSVESSKAEREALTDQALISAIHRAPPARYGFSYRVSFKNNGSKEITAIDWDYVFYDSISETELGRREFGSDQKIAPGKTKELKFFISTPPVRRISVQALEKNERAGLGERVELVRIQYADGTSWQRPQLAP
ncbi:MAG TPA: hypothetical protein VFV61_10435 [Pyrinomonadaceae bacterium]|jgi:hypothetical protein|nr:hypothetical protein [Pyrinomonadaceae bacterium]